ncbi:Nitric oxide-associated protein 1 [Dufourea novaeangliae]|uniref:Nitric oxide-associated protein 1 n=2 Tax=Dufourea novaeangliae TaxID=178035 RepID=A0A154PBB9_DUFNO|nr:Nitric oxide-associated protein 1 [Dufourea novaeangliae]
MYISRVRSCLSHVKARSILCSSRLYYSQQTVLNESDSYKVDPKVLALREKLLYCDHLDLQNLRLGYTKRKQLQKKQQIYTQSKMQQKLFHEPVFSVMWDEKNKSSSIETETDNDIEVELKEQKPVHMPYSRIDTYEAVDVLPEKIKEKTHVLLNQRYKDLYEKHLALEACSKIKSKRNLKELMKDENIKTLPKGELWKVPPTWMSDFEQFNETETDRDWYKNYGTPDPLSTVSSIPCGGCGALLHCKDPAIPGYLPSELFSHCKQNELKLTVCQRCHFLKFYNAALEVKVSVEDYPKLLSTIKRKKCAVLLMVDLTDFPGSIWPNLKSVLHPFTPIFLVGNKVDLLPRDCPTFFDNVKQQLLNTVLDVTGINTANVTHVALASAKTGYGVEELINKLQRKWRYKGDVYLVGCTNVGKSSMFNALLKSDYCKIQAVDLIQRATISPWPGTTLNLLKFPILNPQPQKLMLRARRLKQEQSFSIDEKKKGELLFKKTGKIKFATLQGYIGRTFTERTMENAPIDPFSEKSHKFMDGKLGFDESQLEYAESRWCYDTPGTIQRDQTLDLLTTDELLLTLPQETIVPRTFIFRPKETVFVAGMGRLDFLEGDLYIRCTLFTSKELPITMCYTNDADEIYEQLLQTEAFVVPSNDPERLKVWPKLEGMEMKLTGISRHESVADVVLSSIGWIAITPHENQNIALKAWTPQARGLYLRTPALLKKSVMHRGIKTAGTPLYSLGKKMYVK